MTPAQLGALRHALDAHARRFPDAPPLVAYNLDPEDAGALAEAIQGAIRDGRPLGDADAWAVTGAGRLEAAIHAYGRRFPRRGLPFLRPAGSPEGREVAIRLLRAAVAAGRPLDGWAIARALGLERPPEDACW